MFSFYLLLSLFLVVFSSKGGKKDKANDPILSDEGKECVDINDPPFLVMLQVIEQDDLYDSALAALTAYTTVENESEYSEKVVNAVQNIDFSRSEHEVRLVLILPDGTLIYDNFSDKNSYAASRAKNNEDRINENHNTRVAVINAQIQECGYGYEHKRSRTTGLSEHYVARRVGPRYENVGTVRVSVIDE